jgi:putative ABC transport system permease protein
MRKGLYRRLAWTGIQKNKKLYLPYLFTCIGMVMMCYIISFLGLTPTFAEIRGGTSMQSFMQMGFGVMAVFSVVFLFYTNSFLVRRRKKEFGLYNILGLGKKNLALVLFLETLIILAISLAAGLFLGILFSKGAELLMVRILNQQATFQFTIEPASIINTIVLFCGIFALLFLNTMRQVQMANPIALLHSENTGEKPPKGNWFLAIIGALLLGGAYYLAVVIEDPLAAVSLFFVAVIMVILGTYLLFISGSVTLCRLLQKKKSYYYKANHFVSVSSMKYRMKRNGAGLASICILGTMVLVMVSFTTCMFVGAEDSLHSRYPRDINITAYTDSTATLDAGYGENAKALVEEVLQQQGEETSDILEYSMISLVGKRQPGGFAVGDEIAQQQYKSLTGLWQIFIVPVEDYNRIMGEEKTLQPGEALLYTTKNQYYEEDTLQLGDITYQVKERVSAFSDNGVDAMQIVPTAFLFVSDFSETADKLMKDGEIGANINWYYGCNLSGDDEKQIALRKILQDKIDEYRSNMPEDTYFILQLEGLAAGRADFYGLYGGLFYLGILLGIVFVAAAVLIIYYKQISEGFEDQSRFEIMQKVGMTKKEIRRSINSQILTVFFMPLLTAGVHLAFAFPLLQKLLMLFGIMNQALLIFVSLCCYLVFALFYMFVYRITSRSYYAIVSGARGDRE